MIQSYVSAVKAILRDDGIEIEDNSVALAALIRSSKQMNRTESRTRMTIQKGLLCIILDHIENYFSLRYESTISLHIIQGHTGYGLLWSPSHR